jgi:hypothetical protein
MWPLRTIGYLGVFSVACLLSLTNPIWGIVNYMVVYQIDPTDLWWGQPLTDIGLRFSLLAAAFTMLGLITARKHVPQVRPAFSLWEWGLVGMFLIAAGNALLGIGFGPASRTEFEKFWKVLLFTLIFTRLASSRTNFKMILWTLVAGSLYLGYDAYTAPSWAFVLGRLETVGGPDFSTTSGAAAHLSAMLPLIGAAFLTAWHWKWRIFAVISGAFAFNAVIMCRTRSAFVGLLVGLLTAFMVAPRAQRYRIHALLIGGCALAFTLTDEHFWERMQTLTDQQALDTDLATVSRREIWIASIDILADYPLGVGVGNFAQIIGDYDPRHYKRSSHNSVIVCFLELGIQGGILFGILVAGSLWHLRRAAKLAELSSAPMETKLLVYGVLISLVTYLITALGTQRFYCESFWWVLAMPLCLYRIVLAESAVRESSCEEEAAAQSEAPLIAPVPYAM